METFIYKEQADECNAGLVKFRILLRITSAVLKHTLSQIWSVVRREFDSGALRQALWSL